MREARIICPFRTNAGVALNEVRQHLEAELTHTFGGFTRTIGRGGWRANGTTAGEPIYIYDVAMPQDSEDVRRLFLDLAERLKRAAEQRVVYARTADGEVHYV